MSTGTGPRLPRDQAINLADHVIRLLRPACQRIEIAGSLRRNKPDVGDLEIVCIPHPFLDLFSGVTWPAAEIGRLLRSEYPNIIMDGSRYKKANVGPCTLDLFITTPERWGVIFMIRTGSAEFSRKMVTGRREGGYMPSYLQVNDGRVWNGSEALETPQEEDVFRIYGMEFRKPKDRNE